MKETLKNYLIKKRMENGCIYNWEMTEDPSRDGNIRVKIKVNFNDNIYGIIVNVPKFSNPEIGLTWFKNILKKEIMDLFQKYIDEKLEV